MQTKIATALSVIIILIFSLYGMKALFNGGFYTSHDGWHQIARFYHFDQALKDGQFPPRWSGNLLNGFGYPIFIFSYHLPWWFAELFKLTGLSIFTSIKAVFVLTYILSGIFMYFWIKDMWGIRAGLVSSIVYLWTPYRFANILVRANIGESVSFLFLPFIYWSFYKLQRKITVTPIIMGSLGVAGLILSHAMIIFLFAIPLVLYFLALLSTQLSKKKYLFAVAISIFLGFGLSAYYLVPAVIYKPITVFNDFYHNLYLNYFTPLSKLIYSPWGYGALGTNGEMSRQIGISIWLSITLSVFLISYFLLKKKKSLFEINNQIALIFCFTFFYAVFMMLKDSINIWKIIEPFALIDFPWRFLSVTTFSGSVLAGYIVSKLKGKLQIIIALILIIISIYTNRNHIRVNQYTDIPLSLYLSSELTTNTDDEYLPKWVDRIYARDEKIKLISDSNLVLNNLLQTSKEISFSYVLPESAEINIHHMYFPEIQAFLDGYNISITKNDKGGVKIYLIKGNHDVRLLYRPTIFMRVSEIITLICVSIIIVLLLKINKLKFMKL